MLYSTTIILCGFDIDCIIFLFLIFFPNNGENFSTDVSVHIIFHPLLHYRSQPYLGWRSQTSLNNLDSSGNSSSTGTTTTKYLSAAERLALSMPQHKLSKTTSVDSTQIRPTVHQPISTNNINKASNIKGPTTQQPTSKNHMVSSNVNNSTDDIDNSGAGSSGGGCDIHSSIKEVTSAIVHYCSERAPRSISPRLSSTTNSNLVDGSHQSGRSSTYGSTSENLATRRAGSPRRPQLWLESSFVGSRPIDDSPETPGLPSLSSPLQVTSRPPTAPPTLSSPPRLPSTKSVTSAAPSSRSLPGAQSASTSSSSRGHHIPTIPTRTLASSSVECNSSTGLDVLAEPSSSSTAPATPPTRPNTEALQRLTKQYYSSAATDFVVSCGESHFG